MRVIRRVLAVLLAAGLLGGVVYLGILSGTDAHFVVWFGITSAIVAPVGLSLLGYAASPGSKDIISRLAKVPEIDRLIQEAQSQEEKIRLLEEERARLAEVVKLEARRQAAHDRIESLERDATRILSELTALDGEVELLESQVRESTVSKEIQALQKRVAAREWGILSLRVLGRTYTIDRDLVKALPLGSGNLMVAYLRMIERLQSRHRRP